MNKGSTTPPRLETLNLEDDGPNGSRSGFLRLMQQPSERSLRKVASNNRDLGGDLDAVVKPMETPRMAPKFQGEVDHRSFNSSLSQLKVDKEVSSLYISQSRPFLKQEIHSPRLNLENYQHLLDEPLKNLTQTEEMLLNLINNRRGGIEYLMGNDLCFTQGCQTEVSFNELEK